MSRPLRVEFPGALYHVTSRGNGRRAIFLDDDDRTRFLQILARVRERFSWVCHAYCLLGNHYHLVVETPRANLARGMQQLGSAYAQTFNHRHGRTGHVLQGRYRAILVEKEQHLLEVARYVVLNPVRARLCRDAAEWNWSSYQATAGDAPAPPFLSVDWLLSQFGDDRELAQRRYRLFVRDVAPARLSSRAWGGLYLGTKRFVRDVAPPVQDPIEISRAQREPFQALLSELFADEQARALVAAYREHGYRLREIAHHLGVHPSTASRRLRRAEARLQCKV